MHEKLIQPKFSDQAQPENSPVVGLMVTPYDKVPQLPVLLHEKLIQPAFSDQAKPLRKPLPSFPTPKSTCPQLLVFAQERLSQPMFSDHIQPSKWSLKTVTPGPLFPRGSALSQPMFSPQAYCAPVSAGSMVSGSAAAGLIRMVAATKETNRNMTLFASSHIPLSCGPARLPILRTLTREEPHELPVRPACR